MDNTEVKKPLRLGQKLVSQGVINNEQLKLAIRKQNLEPKRLLGEIMVEYDFIDRDTLSKNISSGDTADYIAIEKIIIPNDVVNLISQSIALKNEMIVFDVDDNYVHVAMTNPLNLEARDLVWKLTHKHVKVYSSPEHDILKAIEVQYRDDTSLDDAVDKIMLSNLDSIDDNESSPVINLLDAIFVNAIKRNATDIHIEPSSHVLKVRIRVDGVMDDLIMLPINVHPYLISRVKVLANIDLAEKRLPQDGRITVNASGKELEIRVSTLRTAIGERIVMRILDKNNISGNLDELGVPKYIQDPLMEQINMPFGIILVTGPTGSGKTTTLYSALSNLDSIENTIFTVEDPVEYLLYGAQQIAVNEDIGLSFQAVLRSVLRQDPDVIMVGEIRDRETAEMAFQAAMTGHLVLSSIHTNSAIDTIYRLIDMGIEPYLIPPSLNAIVAQRLVRKLCDKCKKPMDEDKIKTVVERFKIKSKKDFKWKFFEPVGCEHCLNRGYSGRIGIYEMLELKDEYASDIVNKIGREAFKTKVLNDGFKPMYFDGLRKAQSAVTSIEEILRVTKDI